MKLTLRGLLRLVLVTVPALVLLVGCGGGAPDENVDSASFAVCGTVNSFTVNPASPAAPGAMVTLAATSTCASGTAEYQFQFAPSGSSTYTPIPQPGGAIAYSTTPSIVWNTTGLAPGSYSIVVLVRAVGSNRVFESYRYGSYTLSTGTCSTVTTFTSSPPSIASSGTTVTLTAGASCTNGATPEFLFQYALVGNSTYTTIPGTAPLTNGFSTTPSVTWNTTGLANGNYNIVVLVRAHGNTSAFDGYKYSTYTFSTVGGICSTPGTLSAAPASPQNSGTSIGLTTTPATCTGTATPTYAFQYAPSGSSTFTLIQDFSASRTATWSTSGPPFLTAGTYTLRVLVRANGSVATSESSASISYVLQTGGTCGTLATFTQAPASPQNAGTMVTLSATSTCTGTATPQYWFQFADPGSNVYNTLQDYSASNSVVWNTTGIRSGTYSIVVLAKAKGSNTLFESFKYGSYTINNTSTLTFSSISAGSEGHTCGLVSDGTARCWGLNTWGQLGNGATTNSSLPVTVTGLSGATKVVAGGFHSCAIVAGGVKCWGFNGRGALGNGSTTDSAVPVQVTGLTSGVTDISVGREHACALVGGGVQCWGRNSEGQLGNGTLGGFQIVPVAVTGLTSGVTAIGVGGYHSCAVLTGGTVQCWGEGDFGELGNGSVNRATAAAVTGLSGVSSLSTGGLFHECSIAGTSSSCWGANASGQLGNGATAAAQVTPVALGVTPVTQVVGGYLFGCALTSGSVKCWGDNRTGNLGNNTSTNSLAPVTVSLVSSVTQISAGRFHACSLSAGAARCWGWNADGQLGIGTFGPATTTGSAVPVLVHGP